MGYSMANLYVKLILEMLLNLCHISVLALFSPWPLVSLIALQCSSTRCKIESCDDTLYPWNGLA